MAATMQQQPHFTAIRTVVRSSGEGCEAALQNGRRLSTTSTRGDVVGSGGRWTNMDATSRDTSVTVELRPCASVALDMIGAPKDALEQSRSFADLITAAANEASLSITVTPADPRRSFPTACICSVTAVTKKGPSSGNSSVAEHDDVATGSSSSGGGAPSSSSATILKDIVIREWVLMESRTTPNRFATQVSVRTLRNISALVAGDQNGEEADKENNNAWHGGGEGTRKKGAPRTFFTLRFVGCCDHTGAHAIASLGLCYVFSTQGKELLAQAAGLVGGMYLPQLTPPHPSVTMAADGHNDGGHERSHSGVPSTVEGGDITPSVGRGTPLHDDVGAMRDSSKGSADAHRSSLLGTTRDISINATVQKPHAAAGYGSMPPLSPSPVGSSHHSRPGQSASPPMAKDTRMGSTASTHSQRSRGDAHTIAHASPIARGDGDGRSRSREAYGSPTPSLGSARGASEASPFVVVTPSSTPGGEYYHAGDVHHGDYPAHGIGGYPQHQSASPIPTTSYVVGGGGFPHGTRSSSPTMMSAPHSGATPTHHQHHSAPLHTMAPITPTTTATHSFMHEGLLRSLSPPVRPHMSPSTLFDDDLGGGGAAGVGGYAARGVGNRLPTLQGPSPSPTGRGDSSRRMRRSVERDPAGNFIISVEAQHDDASAADDVPIEVVDIAVPSDEVDGDDNPHVGGEPRYRIGGDSHDGGHHQQDVSVVAVQEYVPLAQMGPFRSRSRTSPTQDVGSVVYHSPPPLANASSSHSPLVAYRGDPAANLVAGGQPFRTSGGSVYGGGDIAQPSQAEDVYLLSPDPRPVGGRSVGSQPQPPAEGPNYPSPLPSTSRLMSNSNSIPRGGSLLAQHYRGDTPSREEEGERRAHAEGARPVPDHMSPPPFLHHGHGTAAEASLLSSTSNGWGVAAGDLSEAEEAVGDGLVYLDKLNRRHARKHPYEPYPAASPLSQPRVHSACTEAQSPSQPATHLTYIVGSGARVRTSVGVGGDDGAPSHDAGVLATDRPPAAGTSPLAAQYRGHSNNYEASSLEGEVLLQQQYERPMQTERSVAVPAVTIPPAVPTAVTPVMREEEGVVRRPTMVSTATSPIPTIARLEGSIAAAESYARVASADVPSQLAKVTLGTQTDNDTTNMDPAVVPTAYASGRGSVVPTTRESSAGTADTIDSALGTRRSRRIPVPRLGDFTAVHQQHHRQGPPYDNRRSASQRDHIDPRHPMMMAVGPEDTPADGGSSMRPAVSIETVATAPTYLPEKDALFIASALLGERAGEVIQTQRKFLRPAPHQVSARRARNTMVDEGVTKQLSDRRHQHYHHGNARQPVSDCELPKVRRVPVVVPALESFSVVRLSHVATRVDVPTVLSDKAHQHPQMSSTAMGQAMVGSISRVVPPTVPTTRAGGSNPTSRRTSRSTTPTATDGMGGQPSVAPVTHPTPPRSVPSRRASFGDGPALVGARPNMSAHQVHHSVDGAAEEGTADEAHQHVPSDDGPLIDPNQPTAIAVLRAEIAAVAAAEAAAAEREEAARLAKIKPAPVIISPRQPSLAAVVVGMQANGGEDEGGNASGGGTSPVPRALATINAAETTSPPTRYAPTAEPQRDEPCVASAAAAAAFVIEEHHSEVVLEGSPVSLKDGPHHPYDQQQDVPHTAMINGAEEEDDVHVVAQLRFDDLSQYAMGDATADLPNARDEYMYRDDDDEGEGGMLEGTVTLSPPRIPPPPSAIVDHAPMEGAVAGDGGRSAPHRAATNDGKVAWRATSQESGVPTTTYAGLTTNPYPFEADDAIMGGDDAYGRVSANDVTPPADESPMSRGVLFAGVQSVGTMLRLADTVAARRGSGGLSGTAAPAPEGHHPAHSSEGHDAPPTLPADDSPEASVWCLKHHARTKGTARRVLDLKRCPDVPSALLRGAMAPRVLMCMRHADGSLWKEGRTSGKGPFVDLSEGTCVLVGESALADGSIHREHVRDVRRCVVIRQASSNGRGDGKDGRGKKTRSRSNSLNSSTAAYYDDVVAAFELTTAADWRLVMDLLQPFIAVDAADGVKERL